MEDDQTPEKEAGSYPICQKLSNKTAIFSGHKTPMLASIWHYEV
jgi:hypothetical protein